MISRAARRHPGLAVRPALFLLALATLLAGCRQAGWQDHEGVALDTGYHLTLNGGPQRKAFEPLRAAIQGELANLERDYAIQRRLVALVQAPRLGELPSLSQALAAWRHEHQARAVDRLDAVLGEFGIEDARIELGGFLRVRGRAPDGGPWRFAIDHAWLPAPDGARVSLRDASLVTLEADAAMDLAAAPVASRRRIAATVVAPSAVQALHQARRLLREEGAGAAEERQARLVVLTPQGIDIQDGVGLEALLER